MKQDRLVLDKTTTKVSVIIPFYKNKKWLLLAIESVLNQTIQDYEVIIINDGSREDIQDIQDKYQQFKFVKIENSGPGVARNVGIDMASGEFVAFLDSDDLWEINKLETQVDFMDKHNCMWSHSNYTKFWDKRNFIQKVDTNIGRNVMPKMFITCPIATPCVMIRRSGLFNNKHLRFAEDTRVGEDLRFWISLANHYPLYHLESFLVRVRIRGTNAAYNAVAQLQSKADIFQIVKRSKRLFKNGVIYYVVLIGFQICSINFKLLKELKHRFNCSSHTEEFFARLLYAFPYLLLKISLIFISKNEDKE